MKKSIYFLLLICSISLLGCKEQVNGPKPYDIDLGNLDRFHLTIGDEVFQFTEFRCVRGEFGGFASYYPIITGENDSLTMLCAFNLACRDSVMLEVGEYVITTAMYPYDLSLCARSYMVSLVSKKEGPLSAVYRSIVSGRCIVRQEGDDFICEFEGLAKDDMIFDDPPLFPMSFKMTFNHELMWGEWYFQPY